MDPGTAAVLGAAVGAAGPAAVTLFDRRGRKQERAEAAEREDHLREINARHDLYLKCIQAVRACNYAVGLAPPPETASTDDLLAGAAVQQLKDAREGLWSLGIQIDLVAPASVRNAYGSACNNAVKLIEVTIAGIEGDDLPPGGSGFDLGTLNTAEDMLVDAMRSDLRIREPR
jgi:hypothetical protein